MIAVSTLLIVLLISFIVVRIASVAFTLGMSRAAAAFQARSAWTGTGFTTEAAEAVLRTPVRRRIIGLLMQLRGVGVSAA